MSISADDKLNECAFDRLLRASRFCKEDWAPRSWTPGYYIDYFRENFSQLTDRDAIICEIFSMSRSSSILTDDNTFCLVWDNALIHILVQSVVALPWFSSPLIGFPEKKRQGFISYLLLILVAEAAFRNDNLDIAVGIADAFIQSGVRGIATGHPGAELLDTTNNNFIISLMILQIMNHELCHAVATLKPNKLVKYDEYFQYISETLTKKENVDRHIDQQKRWNEYLLRSTSANIMGRYCAFLEPSDSIKLINDELLDATKRHEFVADVFSALHEGVCLRNIGAEASLGADVYYCSLVSGFLVQFIMQTKRICTNIVGGGGGVIYDSSTAQFAMFDPYQVARRWVREHVLYIQFITSFNRATPCSLEEAINNSEIIDIANKTHMKAYNICTAIEKEAIHWMGPTLKAVVGSYKERGGKCISDGHYDGWRRFVIDALGWGEKRI